MNFNETHLYKQLQSDLLNFNIKDPLVSINFETSIPIISDRFFKSPEFSKLNQEGLKNQKESGVNSICIIKGLVEIEINNTKVYTPIQLFELEKLEDISEIEMKVIKGGSFPNPFLIDFLNKKFNQNIEFNIEIEELISFLENKFLKINYEKEYLGNFHPFRYELLKDVSEIGKEEEFSQPLSVILGMEELQESTQNFSFSKKNLFPNDYWQNNAINFIQDNSIVVQGPPGTGKSQLISNISGKVIGSQKSLLIVSEKRAALEVIKSKFKDVGLEFLCFINSSNYRQKEIIAELKDTWDLFLKRPITKQKLINQDLLIKEQLRLFINEENHTEFNLKQFLKEQVNLNFNQINFQINAPSIDKWKQIKQQVSHLTETDFLLIKQVRFDPKTSNSIKKNDVISAINKLNELERGFKIIKWKDLLDIMKKAAIFQQFNSTIYIKYKQIIDQKGKLFQKLRNSLLKSKTELELLKKQSSNWTQIPTLLELEFLKKNSQDNSFIGKIKWKTIWKKWTRTPQINPQNQFDFIQRLIKEEMKIIKIKKSLLDMNIESDNEIELINGILNTVDREAWEQYKSASDDELNYLLGNHGELNSLYHFFKNYFSFSDETDIQKYLLLLSENIDRIIFLNELLNNLDNNSIQLLKNVSNINEAEAVVYKSAWINFSLSHPVLLKFNFNQLLTDLKIFIENENEMHLEFANEISNNQLYLFQNYHRLISTPGSKLNESQKKLKAKLRIGKALLVKEFGKQRNYLTLRQLFNSEAKYWLRIIKPVWLTNPIALATLFPAEKEMFDLVIFDEASQIPLSHSIGALHRAKRVLIAGDNQQMGPSTFFTRQNENVRDVLHQASYYYKNITLCGHYRSRHASLIEFSNRYFYHGQLEVFEDFNTKVKNPISFNFIKDGIYAENKNRKEANEVAKFISNLIIKEGKIGIVAFSETQLLEIYNSLNNTSRQLLDERIEKNTAFLKSLEQVQGDECDHLIISFGYGYNPDGKFEMRFGPVNKLNGEKRLNVLFSRSREQITFFASVKSIDFKQTENRAVKLLKKWFQQIEEQKSDYKKSSEIYIEDLIFQSKSIADFTTKYSLYKSRNWDIKTKFQDFPSRLGTGS